jgi:hypothetical protein
MGVGLGPPLDLCMPSLCNCVMPDFYIDSNLDIKIHSKIYITNESTLHCIHFHIFKTGMPGGGLKLLNFCKFTVFIFCTPQIPAGGWVIFNLFIFSIQIENYEYD